MSELKLELESRHSDWGEDAGGYCVLRFNGEWVGRVEDRALAEKMIQAVAALETRYDDSFAQLGVKSLAELTDRYEGRIESLQEEIKSNLEAIPEGLRVIVREGGGQENDAASLAVSIAKMARELEKEKTKRLEIDLAFMLSDTNLPTEFALTLPPTIRLHQYIERQRWLLRQIVSALPQKRDWLDPALEAEARAMIKEK